MAAKRNVKLPIGILLIALAAVFCFSYFAPNSHKQISSEIPTDGISVCFVDVGQGDCAVIASPYGSILIDAGTSKSGDAISECIDLLGIKCFAYAVFTHPHADHIGSAAEMLEKYDFENVIMPDAVSTSKTFEKMLDALEKENCKVISGKEGEEFSLGDLRIRLLAPCKDYSDNLNNSSVVLRVDYLDTSFLFTGDAESASENDMILSERGYLDCDVLKVGHHGSSTSSAYDFLSAIAPDVAIVSVGADNDYGHPHASTLDKLSDIGAAVYRTDKNGTVTVYTDGKTIAVKTEK